MQCVHHQHFPIKDIRFAPFNPPDRVAEANTRDLRRSMEKDGFWPFSSVIIGNGNVLADGHRRVSVARELGIESVPADVIDEDADKWWALWNGTRRVLHTKDVLYAHVMGLNELPANGRRYIQMLDECLGPESLKALVVKHGIAPAIYAEARQLAIYCGLKQDVTFLVQCIYWLTENKMRHTAHTAMRSDIDPRLLIDAVKGNKRIVLGAFVVSE